MKTVFAIQIDHTIDIITNSSSELFVLEGKNAEIVKEMVSLVYSNYLNEYEDVKSAQDLNIDEVETIISYMEDYKEISPFGLPADKLWSNLETRGKYEYWYPELSESGAQLVKDYLASKNYYFLFSLEQNANWDMQEMLSNIGQRYRLG